mmetsp:Transcript_37363/g.98523  ORF Transcript_37363/g.98523 Transcript_37363/m.98523 type:complete len:340 (+) Transcript_37363:432-1451(+)
MDHAAESPCSRCPSPPSRSKEDTSEPASYSRLEPGARPRPTAIALPRLSVPAAARKAANSRSRISMISAGSSSLPSASCQGNSKPERREASCLSSSMAHFTTSMATSSPHLSRTSPKLSRKRPPRASQIGSCVVASKGRKFGSPSKETSRGTPSELVTQPRCSKAQACSSSPHDRNQDSSKRPTKRTGTEAPLRLARRAAARALFTWSWKIFRCASVGPTNSSTNSRRSSTWAFSFDNRSTAACNSSFSLRSCSTSAWCLVVGVGSGDVLASLPASNAVLSWPPTAHGGEAEATSSPAGQDIPAVPLPAAQGASCLDWRCQVGRGAVRSSFPGAAHPRA